MLRKMKMEDLEQRIEENRTSKCYHPRISTTRKAKKSRTRSPSERKALEKSQ